MTYTGVSLEAGYQRSTAACVASHHQLLSLTFKRVVVVISILYPSSVTSVQFTSFGVQGCFQKFGQKGKI